MEEHKQTQLLQLYFEINRKIENLNLYYSICGQIKYGELVKYSKPVFSEIWSLLTRLQAEFMLCKSEMSTSVIKEISKKGFLIVSKQVAEWIAQNERELYRIGGKDNKDLITPYQLQILSLEIIQMFEQEQERREQEQERREQEQERREQEQERREQEQERREQEQELNLPIELQSEKAKMLLGKLVKLNLCDSEYRWLYSHRLLVYLVLKANEYLKLDGGNVRENGKKLQRDKYWVGWERLFKNKNGGNIDLRNTYRQMIEDGKQKPKQHEIVDSIF